jgi:hypothetical protein
VWAALFAGFAAWGTHNWRITYPLQQRGVTVEATIIDLDSVSMGTRYVLYEYQAHMPNKMFSRLRQWQRVTKKQFGEVTSLLWRAKQSNTPPTVQVVYLPENPAIARIKDDFNLPSPTSQAAFVVVMVAIGTLGIVPGWAYLVRGLALRSRGIWVLAGAIVVFVLLLAAVIWVSSPL